MAAQKEDRRIRRTKRLLRQALAELMNEKEFKDITVKEITDRADLNRGTFYFHYTDTYDLRTKIEDELIEEFKQVLASYHPTVEDYSARFIIEQAISYMEEQKFLFRTLFCNKSGEGLQTKFTAVLEDTICMVQQQLNLTDSLSKYRCKFSSSGIIGCLDEWLQDDEGISNDTLIDCLDQMINRAIGV